MQKETGRIAKRIDPALRRKLLLQSCGISQTQVAEEASVSRQMVHRVVMGQDKSRNIEDVIIRLTGIDKSILFPDE